MFPTRVLILLLPLLQSTWAYSGDMTYYTPGLGSCGITNTESDLIVALSQDIMQNSGSPNNNNQCGSQISIWNPSNPSQGYTATVVDTCIGCSMYDIDVSPALFKLVAPNGDGRVHGVDWGGNVVGG